MKCFSVKQQMDVILHVQCKNLKNEQQYALKMWFPAFSGVKILFYYNRTGCNFLFVRFSFLRMYDFLKIRIL